MSFLSPTVAAWLGDHHGVVTNEALTKLGVSVDERRRLVQRRVLARIVNGAYRFTGSPDCTLQRCAALCGARPTYVVGGATAAWIWGMRGYSAEPSDVHALAPYGARTCTVPWLRLHRTDVLPAEDVVRRADGIAVTSPPRTVVDLARDLPPGELALLIEWALSKDLATPTSLRRVAGRLAAPGRPWVRRLLQALDDRIPGGPRESGWEQRVMAALHERGVTDLVSQVRQRIPGYGPARFDLAIAAIRWVLEVDVHPSHRTTAGQSSDHRRDRKARRVGWQTERVGEDELVEAFDATMEDLAESIDGRRAEVANLITAGLWQV